MAYYGSGPPPRFNPGQMPQRLPHPMFGGLPLPPVDMYSHGHPPHHPEMYQGYDEYDGNGMHSQYGPEYYDQHSQYYHPGHVGHPGDMHQAPPFDGGYQQQQTQTLRPHFNPRFIPPEKPVQEEPTKILRNPYPAISKEEIRSQQKDEIYDPSCPTISAPTHNSGPVEHNNTYSQSGVPFQHQQDHHPPPSTGFSHHNIPPQHLQPVPTPAPTPHIQMQAPQPPPQQHLQPPPQQYMPPPMMANTATSSTIPIFGENIARASNFTRYLAGFEKKDEKVRSDNENGNKNSKMQVMTGVVTQMQPGAFGMISEEIFYQESCVTGPLPKLGDKVVVEAEPVSGMPFKFNGKKVTRLDIDLVREEKTTNSPQSQSNHNTPQPHQMQHFTSPHLAPLPSMPKSLNLPKSVPQSLSSFIPSAHNPPPALKSILKRRESPTLKRNPPPPPLISKKGTSSDDFGRSFGDASSYKPSTFTFAVDSNQDEPRVFSGGAPGPAIDLSEYTYVREPENFPFPVERKRSPSPRITRLLPQSPVIEFRKAPKQHVAPPPEEREMSPVRNESLGRRRHSPPPERYASGSSRNARDDRYRSYSPGIRRSRSRSKSPTRRAPRSRSRSFSPRKRNLSRSPSPSRNRRRSRSASPHRVRRRSRSDSLSRGQRKSRRSSSRNRRRSRSASPRSRQRSRSGSPRGRRKDSYSPRSRRRSRSVTPKSRRKISRSPSPSRNRRSSSRSRRTYHSHRSRSRSLTPSGVPISTFPHNSRPTGNEIITHGIVAKAVSSDLFPKIVERPGPIPAIPQVSLGALIKAKSQPVPIKFQISNPNAAKQPPPQLVPNPTFIKTGLQNPAFNITKTVENPAAWQSTASKKKKPKEQEPAFRIVDDMPKPNNPSTTTTAATQIAIEKCDEKIKQWEAERQALKSKVLSDISSENLVTNPANIAQLKNTIQNDLHQLRAKASQPPGKNLLENPTNIQQLKQTVARDLNDLKNKGKSAESGNGTSSSGSKPLPVDIQHLKTTVQQGLKELRSKFEGRNPKESETESFKSKQNEGTSNIGTPTAESRPNVKTGPTGLDASKKTGTTGPENSKKTPPVKDVGKKIPTAESRRDGSRPKTVVATPPAPAEPPISEEMEKLKEEIHRQRFTEEENRLRANADEAGLNQLWYMEDRRRRRLEEQQLSRIRLREIQLKKEKKFGELAVLRQEWGPPSERMEHERQLRLARQDEERQETQLEGQSEAIRRQEMEYQLWLEDEATARSREFGRTNRGFEGRVKRRRTPSPSQNIPPQHQQAPHSHHSQRRRSRSVSYERYRDDWRHRPHRDRSPEMNYEQFVMTFGGARMPMMHPDMPHPHVPHPRHHPHPPPGYHPHPEFVEDHPGPNDHFDQDGFFISRAIDDVARRQEELMHREMEIEQRMEMAEMRIGGPPPNQPHPRDRDYGRYAVRRR